MAGAGELRLFDQREMKRLAGGRRTDKKLDSLPWGVQGRTTRTGASFIKTNDMPIHCLLEEQAQKKGVPRTPFCKPSNELPLSGQMEDGQNSEHGQINTWVNRGHLCLASSKTTHPLLGRSIQQRGLFLLGGGFFRKSHVPEPLP